MLPEIVVYPPQLHLPHSQQGYDLQGVIERERERDMKDGKKEEIIF